MCLLDEMITAVVAVKKLTSRTAEFNKDLTAVGELDVLEARGSAHGGWSDTQDIPALEERNAYPVVDLRVSLSAAQSASDQPVKRSSVAPWMYLSPKFLAPLR